MASLTSLCLAGRASIAAALRFHAAAQIAHHVGKLGALGFEVTLARIAGPEPDAEAGTSAA